jgi:beta-lactamase regulating signal transducer with metallopeptidase domain
MALLTSWLLTYLLHSTLLLAGAAVLCHVLKERRLGLQEAVLRAALVGGFLTASLQLGLGVRPLGGVLALPEDPATVASGEPAQIPGAAAIASPERADIVFGSLPTVLEEVRAEDDAERGPAGWSFPAPSVWSPALTGLWGAVALLALLRLSVAAVRLRRLLRQRHRLAGEHLVSRAELLAAGLGLRRPVPLSSVPRLEVPLATGVLRPEVCLPTRALEELEEEQQVALCAHELAHVARRDPAWILVARLAEALVPLQPFNTWARRRLQHLAECLSDDLAVAASGRPLGLARSLVDVASWTVAETLAFPAAAGALSARSRLGQRVERLMDPVRRLERPGRLLLPLAAVAVLATALVTPVVSGSPVASALPEPLQGPPEAAPAPEARPAPEAPPAPPAPEAPPAPKAPEVPASEAAERLEELTRTIQERITAQTTGMAELGEEIQALVHASVPDAAEMERLREQIASAAHILAEAREAGEEGSREVEEAREQMREARKQLREATRGAGISPDQRQRLREKSRQIARAARLTAEEREEMRRLTRQITRESMAGMDDLHGEMRELHESLAETMHSLHETLRESIPDVAELNRIAHEAAREAHEAAREAREEARAEAREAREKAREAERESRREGTRGLEEAEESHLEETSEGPPDIDDL